MRALRLTWMVAACLVLAGCPPKGEVWVDGGSTAERVVLRLSGERGGRKAIDVYDLRVYDCGAVRRWQGPALPPPERAAWVIERQPAGGLRARLGMAPKLHRVVYGRVPEGFVARKPAEPLRTSGCYVVATLPSTAATGFEIAATGAVRELSEGELVRLGV